MLGKLMKYEFKATGRIFLPIYGALIIVAIVNRLLTNLSSEVPSVIGTTIFIIMIVAICVITLILTLQRFYKNLLGNEGYLMFTLPVNTDSIIWSKLLVSSIWFIVSGLVVILAILILAFKGVNIQQIFDSLYQAFSDIDVPTRFVLYIIEAVIACILGLFSSILMLYACMSLGLIVNKHRALFAFGAFVGFCIIGQIIAAIFMSAGLALGIDDVFMGVTPDAQVQSMLLFTIACGLIACLVFYGITRYMLRNRLNLE